MTPIYDQLRGERINADVPPTGVTHHWSVTPANTLCWPSRRFRPRCSDQVQRLILTQTSTISCRHTRRVSPQVTGNGRSRCGDRERPVRW
jgi:hypothetical protein